MVNDFGFGYASASEPYRYVDVDLQDLGVETQQVNELYSAEVLLRQMKPSKGRATQPPALVLGHNSKKGLNVVQPGNVQVEMPGWRQSAATSKSTRPSARPSARPSSRPKAAAPVAAPAAAPASAA